MQIDLNKYSEFVGAVTSNESKDLTTFMNRLDRLDGNYEAYGPNGEMQHGPDVNVPLLITACFGLAAESGEFCEIPKQLLFNQAKLTEEKLIIMKSKLANLLFYWVTACNSLNISPNDILQENINKIAN